MPPRPKPERRCHLCQKVFGKTEHLERHIRSHTHDKPFTCNVCNKSFSRNDTLLRHWRSHGVNGPPPASSVSQARRPQNQLVQPPSAPGNPPPGQPHRDAHSGQLVQQQPLPEFNPYNGYPPLEVQGYSQHVPDRHTEAASVLLTLPQSHPSFTSNPQDNSPLNHDFGESGLPPFPPTGQEGQSQMLPDYTDDALDPMLQMTAAQGQATMDGQAASQLAHQYPTAQHQQHSPSHLGPLQPIVRLTDHSVFDNRFQGNVASNFTIEDETLPKKEGDKSAAPAVNGNHVKLEAGLPEEIWYNNNEDKEFTFGVSSTVSALLRPAKSEYLNLTVKLFFTRFAPVFPVVHAPSFHVTTDKNLLLRAIIALGSLYTGSRAAAAAQISAFENLNQLVNDAWEKHQYGDSDNKFFVIQAGLIAKLSGFLSGLGGNLALAEADHELLALWVANLGAVDNTETLKLLNRDNPPPHENLEQIWQTWALNEEKLRVLHGLRVLDAELAHIFTRDPSVMLSANTLPAMAPDDLFQAWTSQEWFAMIQNKYPTYLEPPANSFDHELRQFSPRGDPTSRFGPLTLLEGISSNIQEARLQATLGERIEEFSAQLMDFYNRYCTGPQVQDSDPYSLAILWHATFIDLLVDYHMFENAFGKHGTETAKAHEEFARQWASSETAKRCLIHAALLEHHVNNLPIGREIAIHIPRSLFIAAMIVYGFSEFTTNPRDALFVGGPFPELELVAANMSIPVPRPSFGGDDFAYRLTDLLLRVGHFEISRKFAATLEGLLLHRSLH